MEGRDITDAGRAFQSTMDHEDRRSTCKDRFEKTRQNVSPSAEQVGSKEQRKGEVEIPARPLRLLYMSN